MDRLLRVQGLSIDRPDGRPLFAGLDLDVEVGEIVVVLGASGGGMTTLGRVLVDRAALEAEGFKVRVDKLEARSAFGFVPKRGAPFDHLDVADNLRLALRQNPAPVPDEEAAVRDWLARADLDARLVRPGTRVSALSDGQGQRLAVARAQAGGHQLLFLDEPSAGLDPARVRLLARQLRNWCERDRAGFLVATHSLELAVGIADRILLLQNDLTFAPFAMGNWPGAFDSTRSDGGAAARAVWIESIESNLVDQLNVAPRVRMRGIRPGAVSAAAGAWLRARVEPFDVAWTACTDGALHALARARDTRHVLARVLGHALLRPLLLYALVSVLLGFAMLYVLVGSAPPGLLPATMLGLLGNTHIVALTPPISGILFAATSGSAVSRWLGRMGFTGQIAALEALGIKRRFYLWPAAFWGLFAAALGAAAIVGAGMTVGGFIATRTMGVENGWQMLTAELLDPRPERRPYLVRALCLVLIYAAGTAAEVVASGTAPKRSADDVVRTMTGMVIRSMLWIGFFELASVVLVLDML